jgi:hypothetical protein
MHEPSKLIEPWETRKAQQKLFDLMIPHKVFAWKPLDVDHGYAWLENVWCFAYFEDPAVPIFKYRLTYDEALKASREYNPSNPSSRYGLSEEAAKRLYKRDR